MTSITLDRHPVTNITSRILATDSSPLPLILRIALGVVMLPHGLQKVFGWFGGYGFEGTLGGFASMGIPAVLGVLAIAAESAGAVALIAGFATRIAAFGVGVTMAVAAFLVHASNGFFMNWSGQQAGEGFEYHILAIALALVLVIAGGGRWSVDRAILESRA